MAFPTHPSYKGTNMNTKKPLEKERSFSIELTSKLKLKTVALNGDAAQNVLIEGTLGELKSACFVALDILEVRGSAGTLRVNISQHEILEVKQQ
jgi:hypothetical protein